MSDLLTRITIDPEQMHGRPCIRGLRVTVADILGLLSSGQSREMILKDYPYLESDDIDAAWPLPPVRRIIRSSRQDVARGDDAPGQRVSADPADEPRDGPARAPAADERERPPRRVRG